MADGTTNRKLTKQQLAILTLAYQLRFITTRHVQAKLGNKQLQQTQRRLNTLVASDYLGRNYTARDRLNGKYASYYLTSLGMRALKQYADWLDPSVLHAIYKDKNASERFIAHCVAVGNVWHSLKTQYGKLLAFYPKSSISSQEHYPQDSKPDAFIKLKTKLGKGSRTKQYLLYVCEEATPMFVHKRTIENLMEYVDEGDWEAETETKLPIMLLVCDSKKLKIKLQKLIERMMDNTGMDEEDVVFEVILLSQEGDSI